MVALRSIAEHLPRSPAPCPWRRGATLVAPSPHRSTALPPRYVAFAAGEKRRSTRGRGTCPIASSAGREGARPAVERPGVAAMAHAARAALDDGSLRDNAKRAVVEP